MDRRRWIWGASTLLVAAWATSSSLGLLAGAAPVMNALELLGYPEYFRFMLGSAKLLAALALVVPMVPGRIREWAYAGLAIELYGAMFSYAMAAPEPGRLLPPMGISMVVAVSYWAWRSVEGRRLMTA